MSINENRELSSDDIDRLKLSVSALSSGMLRLTQLLTTVTPILLEQLDGLNRQIALLGSEEKDQQQ
ncbi:hypothetical protein [Bradyrhizobium pachyrhizi]|uniref:hypothetical protein n=1 Tax=Bradyrhizobium pachyrhizi TaxID=280333 RepID=UPI00067AEA38|nr:hypothetical protein [Bradyrhizobium pachyrhizi]